MRGDGIVVIGEAVLDIVRDYAGIESAYPGGSPTNVAVGLARLGQNTCLVSEWAHDDAGARIARHVGDEGVAVGRTSWSASTPTARAYLQADGSAEYDFDIGWSLGLDGVEAVDSFPAHHLHTGSLATQLMPGAAAVLHIVERMRPTMTVSFDPNARAQLVGDHSVAARRAEKIVELADVVKASDEDLQFLYPDLNLNDVVADWLRRGPSLVIITRGSEGSTVYLGGRSLDVPAVATTVKDTVGAGDSFMSALLDGLASLGYLGVTGKLRIGSATLEDVIPAVQRASRAAAITVSRAGANPPNSIDLGAGLGS